ncbi:hypothetical protein Q3G72_019381 [Acer saccharum]|nr:hypothetical protein Q3G72_019381 [Acer saccharum]
MSDKLSADNWDLTAVVRGCSSATDDDDNNIKDRNLPQKFRTTTAAASTTAGGGASENTLSILSSLKFEEEEDPFFFPNLVQETDNNGFDELQDSFKQFLYNDNLHQHEQQQPPPPPPPPLTMTTTSEVLATAPARPISTTTTTSSSLNFVFGDHPDHLVHHHHQSQPQPQSVARDQSCLRPFRHVQSRSRKRKTPLKRIVCHVTAENLSTDLWAWRKYGQKPIKGSPYPRNYYRCSSSKGCLARKQVERSNTDPNIFVVSYTGDHTHPRPTHRNSLAGSSRNKLPRVQNLVAEEAAPPPVPSEEEKADDAGDNHEEEDDEDDLLIPNFTAVMDEDPFSGLDEFHSHNSASSGGDGGG